MCWETCCGASTAEGSRDRNGAAGATPHARKGHPREGTPLFRHTQAEKMQPAAAGNEDKVHSYTMYAGDDGQYVEGESTGHVETFGRRSGFGARLAAAVVDHAVAMWRSAEGCGRSEVGEKLGLDANSGVVGQLEAKSNLRYVKEDGERQWSIQMTPGSGREWALVSAGDVQRGFTAGDSNWGVLAPTTPDNSTTTIPRGPAACPLLDKFAISIQLMMAAIAACSLIYKHAHENPKRPHFVWALDTSKQVVAAVMVHFSNIAIAMLENTTTQGKTHNPCIWYFLNIFLDTTVGVLILAFYIRQLTNLFTCLGAQDISSGFYGRPPRLWPWFKQLLLFLTAWFWVKVTVVLFLTYTPFLVAFAQWLLSPLVGDGNDTRFQVIVVMLIFPMIMNIIQALLIDQVIKNKDARYYTNVDEDEPHQGNFPYGAFENHYSENQGSGSNTPRSRRGPVEDIGIMISSPTESTGSVSIHPESADINSRANKITSASPLDENELLQYLEDKLTSSANGDEEDLDDIFLGEGGSSPYPLQDASKMNQSRQGSIEQLDFAESSVGATSIRDWATHQNNKHTSNDDPFNPH